MYLGLFLMPWVLMYALSTIAMNHREHLRTGEPQYVAESERSFDAAFSPGLTPRQQAALILRQIGMDGAYSVGRPAPDGTLSIQRLDSVTPRRIVYSPAERKLKIERMIFETPAFLERMHRRRGYQHDYAADDVWAFTVDLFIAAIVFWAVSGLWMWWEMRVTRRWGAMFAAAGAALFVFFLARL
jgi:hypothetical protein